jgi:hypothetical protein
VGARSQANSFSTARAAELSVAYRILVPERRLRLGAVVEEVSPQGEQCGDLRPGVLGQAKEQEKIDSQLAALRVHAEQLV